jgi:protein-S-isoprenylcysteine O-methyltransferase Ste14
MKETFTFRIVFWVHLILIMIFNRLLPALRAKKSGAKLSPDHEAIENEGKFWFAFRVTAGLLLAAVIVIYSFFPTFNTRFQFPLPSGLKWAGAIISSICLLFWIYSQAVLDKNWSANLKIQKEHTLVTSGPYSMIRHPIYTAMIFWSVGLALFTANIFFAAFAGVVILWTPPRIAKEEKMLIGHFGDAYLNYMKTAGRYFPIFRHH